MGLGDCFVMERDCRVEHKNQHSTISTGRGKWLTFARSVLQKEMIRVRNQTQIIHVAYKNMYNINIEKVVEDIIIISSGTKIDV